MKRFAGGECSGHRLDTSCVTFSQLDYWGVSMGLNVEPDVLRRFADNIGGISDTVRGLDAHAPFIEATDAVAGTEVPRACASSGDVIQAALVMVANRLSHMSDIAKGSAENYDVAEAEFTARLNAMGPAQ